jgi:predicted DNA-binding transcriptional regulator AlpA
MAPQLARDLAVVGLLEGHTGSDVFLPARKVWERYNVTPMTLWRWSNSTGMDFPAPVYLGRFRYWRLADIQTWEATRPRKRPKTLSLPAAIIPGGAV